MTTTSSSPPRGAQADHRGPLLAGGHRHALATNPIRFAPGADDPARSCDLTFTGNYWDVPRDVAETLPALAGEYEVKVLAAAGRRRRMAPLLAGILAYEELPRAYASATLVVDDTATHAKPFQAVNSRVFDALASGTLVVTNCDGVRELFDADFNLERRGVAAALVSSSPAIRPPARAGGSLSARCWSSTPTPGGPSSFGTC